MSRCVADAEDSGLISMPLSLGSVDDSVDGSTSFKSPNLVGNHVASMDDPLVIAALVPPQVFLGAQNLRWTLCAIDRCFSNAVFFAFFRFVKVLLVARGDGIYQKVFLCEVRVLKEIIKADLFKIFFFISFFNSMAYNEVIK